MVHLPNILLLALPALSSAARLTISLVPSQLLPNPSTLPSTSHAILLGPPGIRYDAPIRRDNTFQFPNIPEASYLLTLHTRDYIFPPLRVDVVTGEDGGSQQQQQNISAWQTFRGNEWGNKGPSLGSARGELVVEMRPSNEKGFYQVRGGFNVLSFLKSPMILMGLFSVVLIVGMPYLMENMDPETKAEFEEMSKQSPLTGSSGAASQVQNFDLAGFLAGRSSAPEEKPAAVESSGKKKK